MDYQTTVINGFQASWEKSEYSLINNLVMTDLNGFALIKAAFPKLRPYEQWIEWIKKLTIIELYYFVAANKDNQQLIRQNVTFAGICQGMFEVIKMSISFDSDDVRNYDDLRKRINDLEDENRRLKKALRAFV